MEVAPRYKLLTLLGKASRKKWLFFFYFVEMRGWGGEGPAQIFCHIFTNCILGQSGDREEGGDPCPIFLAHWRSKKVIQVVQIRGIGGGGQRWNLSIPSLPAAV